MARAEPHILFVCHEMPPCAVGGSGSAVMTSARACRDRGYQVTIAGLYEEDSVDDFEGIQVYRTARSRSPVASGHLGRLRLRALLRRIHRERPIDLIESQDYLGLLLPLGGRDSPAVITRLDANNALFSMLGGVRRKPRLVRCERRQMLRSDCLVAPSRFCASETRRLLGLPDRLPVHVVYYPVDTDLFRPGERLANRILYAGTLTRRKGVFPLVEALVRLAAERPELEVILVGKDGLEGPARASVKGELQARVPAEVRDRFRFLPPMPRDELASLVRTATLGIYPSLAETFCLVVAETLACGVPVVSSRMGPIPEIVQDGDSGLLVEPGSAEEILAAARTLLADPERAASMGRKGREHVVANFSVERWLETKIPLYEAILAGESGARDPAGREEGD
ncbi:MAG: glycosyltransferase family 4 protein [Planctomycetes bacterium]|nr:glycosyltransferase family 4 protein [Planctomycetota bacterium]